MHRIFVSETGQGDERITVTITRNDIIAFVDPLAKGFRAQSTAVFTMRPQEGFKELGEILRLGKVNISGFKIVALLIGRADLWIDNTRFENSLQHCISAIQDLNPKAIILLAATLPGPGDPRALIDTSNYRSVVMARLAAKYAKLEFSKPGKRLIRKPGGAIKEFYDENRCLTAQGLLQVQKCFEAKITYGKI